MEKQPLVGLVGDDPALATPGSPKTPPITPQRQGRSGLTSRPRAACAVFIGLLLLSALIHPVSRCRNHRSAPNAHSPARTLEQRASKILAENPLIDGHDDLAILIRGVYGNHIYERNFTESFENGGMPGHVDLPRLRGGQNGGAFWSVFVPCPANGTDFSSGNYAESVQATLDQVDLMHRLQRAYPWDLSRAEADSRAALAGFRQQGRLISPLGVEGLHQIGNSAANLRHYAERGVRYASLTHNCGNAYADAALREVPAEDGGAAGGVEPAPPHWGGVSPRGRDLVREMNRIGVMVDLAHTSEATMVDILGGNADNGGWQGSRAPVLFSHSSAYSLCPHPRNVPDHVLRLVQKTDSVVMVNFSPDFISCAAPPAGGGGMPVADPAHPPTLSRVADHITYIGSLIGYEHVGVGSDFDGIGSTPEGLDDVSRFPALIAELLRRGLSDADAARVAGGNVLRVWRAAEDVAARMQAAGEPILEDGVPAAVPSPATAAGGSW